MPLHRGEGHGPADVMPLLTASGGTLVKRLRVDKTINGTPSGMVMVMDFESADHQVDQLFASAEYAALLPARDQGSTDMNTLVARPL